MRAYKGEFTVGSILEMYRKLRGYPARSILEEIDTKELARIIDRIPIQKIRERRILLKTVYEEVMESADSETIIHFSECLMTARVLSGYFSFFWLPSSISRHIFELT